MNFLNFDLVLKKKYENKGRRILIDVITRLLEEDDEDTVLFLTKHLEQNFKMFEWARPVSTKLSKSINSGFKRNQWAR